MNVQDHAVDVSNFESLECADNAVPSARPEPNSIPAAATGSVARQRIRATARMLGSLLLGVVAVLGSIIVSR